MTNNILPLEFSQVKWLVLVTYLLGLILDSMSNFGLILGNYPSFTLLVIFYWTITLQNKTHLFSAFLLGLLSDALFNTPLGAHALIFSLLVFILLRIRLQFKNYPLWQQTFFLTGYFYLFQILGLILLQPSLSGDSLIMYWSIPLITLLLWPIIHQLLNKIAFKAVYT